MNRVEFDGGGISPLPLLSLQTSLFTRTICLVSSDVVVNNPEPCLRRRAKRNLAQYKERCMYFLFTKTTVPPSGYGSFAAAMTPNVVVRKTRKNLVLSYCPMLCVHQQQI